MEFSTYTPHQHQPRLVDQDHMRRAIGRFASGVTIITTHYSGSDYGLTASAVSALSLDPPMLLICVNKSSYTQQAIKASGVFAVNILQEKHIDVARRFATSHADKFDGLRITYGSLGVPLLDGMLATLECHVTMEVPGGTHTVFLAEVHSAQANEGMPLAYFRGRMGRFTFASSDMETVLWSKMQWEDAA